MEKYKDLKVGDYVSFEIQPKKLYKVLDVETQENGKVYIKYYNESLDYDVWVRAEYIEGIYTVCEKEV